MSNFCCWVKSKNSGSYSSDLNIFLTLSFFLTFRVDILKPCDFPVIKHGRLYYAFKGYFPASVGQRFSYRCNRYFVTPSQSSWDYMTCTLKGWSPEVPCLRQCTFNYLENGYYTNSQEKYLQGKTVRVRCHDGYSLHNNQNTMTCTEKGWYPPPICVRLPCGPPPSIQNGVVHHKNDSYQYGEKVTYTCTKGFRIYGFASIRCLGGKWSRTPKCISITLKEKGGPPPPIDNGDITSLLTPVCPLRSAVAFQRQAACELQGKRSSVGRNGERSGPPERSEACEISEEMMKKHNIQLKWTTSKKLYSKTQDRIEFICKRGYRPVTPYHTFQTACQEGKVVYPHCE
uniref:Sushi domain-containing protein n=1 Tax=Moschus moschiferus TaxID=68415 RepID=A0A8C6DFG8_MOSMO